MSQIEPKHYTEMALSPLEYIEANEGEFTWCISNVIKYVSRYKRKNGVEDLLKSLWYLKHEIENEILKLDREKGEMYANEMQKMFNSLLDEVEKHKDELGV